MPRKYPHMGLHLINKTRGMSSNKCMIEFRDSLDPPMPRDIKIGYAGTLDMLAEGLLIIGIGRQYTKQLQQLSDETKTYRTIINLSGWTASGDMEQRIQTNPAHDPPDYDQIYDVIESMIGPQKQVPPVFSAKKVNGRRAYLDAREGKDIQLKECDITIYDIELLDYDYPQMEISVTCSKGTFIRTLAMEIGTKLTGGAYVERLVRTRVGDYELNEERRP